MAGKKPKYVYVYDEEGVYICMFESMVKFREVYYPKDIGKRPLFNHEEFDIKYHYLEDLGLIAITDRSAGRDLIKRIVTIHNSEYCKKNDKKDDKVIQVFNLKNEVIAEFKNQRLLIKLMPHISQSTISRHLNTKLVNTHNSVGLFFKYK
jgi:hypothetical protein